MKIQSEISHTFLDLRLNHTSKQDSYSLRLPSNVVFALILLSTTISLLMSSCGTLRPTRPISYCPPPKEPECYQLPTKKVPFDTTSTGKFSPESYWKIEVVNGANSKLDEWGLAFAGNSNVILSYTNGDVQTMSWGYMQNISTFEESSLISSGKLGTISTPALLNNKNLNTVPTTALVSYYPFGSKVSDSDIGDAVLRDTTVVSVVRNSILSKDGWWDAQPTVSSDGKYVCFASDRPGGLGGTDIWISKRLPDGKWAEPINAGDAINSPCDELSPFFSPSGQELLFSSSGRETVGGYDIFSSEIRSESQSNGLGITFAKAENLGAPLNTVSDELFPSTSSKSSTVIYYSSNQNQTTGFDVYVRHRLVFPKRNVADKKPAEKQVEAKEPKNTSTEKEITQKETKKKRLRGVVYDEKKQPVKNADVSVRDVKDDVIIAKTETDTIGRYEVDVPVNREVEITSQHETGFYDSKKLTANEKTPSTVDFVVPTTLYLRINFPNDDFQNPYKNSLDSNGLETNQTYDEQLNLLADNLKRSLTSIRKVILVGHTDENGSIEYNNGLGQRRVEFVLNELVKRGIPRSLLEYRSAGELEPLPRRKSEPMETYFKRNRRVELVKIMQ
jgi:outer membrane protein OmpA-like peptidoglycan-associated protein